MHAVTRSERAERATIAGRATSALALAALQLLVPLLGAGAVLAHARARAASSTPPPWTTLLAPAPVRRLRAAVVVEARDCPATLDVLEWFARPELAGAIGSVTLVVRDGRDSLARYADALLTAPVQLVVVPVPSSLRAQLRRLGAGPRLVLVDPAGQVVLASRIGRSPAALESLRRATERVGDHYLHTELATTSTME
jgi:hypothetical protein